MPTFFFIHIGLLCLVLELILYQPNKLVTATRVFSYFWACCKYNSTLVVTGSTGQTEITVTTYVSAWGTFRAKMLQIYSDCSQRE